MSAPEPTLADYQQAVDDALQTLLYEAGIPMPLWESVTSAGQEWHQWMEDRAAAFRAKYWPGLDQGPS